MEISVFQPETPQRGVSGPGLLLSQKSPAYPRSRSREEIVDTQRTVARTVGEVPDTGYRIVLAPGLVRVCAPPRFGNPQMVADDAENLRSAPLASVRSGGGQRGSITGFSSASRRNLLVALATLDFSEISGTPLFVTLTYPRDWRAVCPSGRDADHVPPSGVGATSG